MMMKKHFAYFTLIALTILISSIANAQAPKKSIVKFKPPVVQSFLGNITGKEAVAGTEEAKNLITLPLKIVGDKNSTYTIASYQFAYTRIGITEDEATGKTTPQSDMVSNQFNVTPLPAIWQSNITETLHKSETLHFFDIIVLDKQGRRFFAPELKITIQ